MITNVIMVICLWVPMVLVYACLSNWNKRNGTLYFGVEMKAKWMESEEMCDVVQSYKKKSRTIFLLGAILPIVTFGIPYVSIQIVIWLVWSILFIVANFIPYAKAHKQTYAYKMTMCETDEEKGSFYVDLATVDQVRRVQAKKYAPIFALTGIIVVATFLFPVFASQEAPLTWNGYRYANMALSLLSFVWYWLALITDRARNEVICEDADINRNYNRARKQSFHHFWLTISWIHISKVTWVMIAMYLSLPTFSVVMWSAMIEVLAGIIISIVFLNRITRIERKYAPHYLKEYRMDEERYWIWGAIYNNPWDKRAIVNTRYGMGSSMNLGTSMGKIFMMIGVIAIISVPIMCTWLIFDEMMPIHARIENETIVCRHLKTEYEIAFNEIEQVYLVEKVPECTKIHGTMTDTLYSGRFEIYRDGVYEMLLNPETAKFLKIVTKDKQYYIGGHDDAEFQALYDNLKENKIPLNE